MTLMHHPARNGRLALVDPLVAKGAIVDAKDSVSEHLAAARVLRSHNNNAARVPLRPHPFPTIAIQQLYDHIPCPDVCLCLLA